MPVDPPPVPERPRTLAVAVAGTFLVLASYTVPLTTLGETATALGSSAANQAWLLAAMSVGLAAALLTCGAIGDDHGRRRVFVAGAVTMTVASLVAALATTTLVFVLARLVLGVGGAAIVSCSLGLIGHAFTEPAERMRATGVWGASIGGGIAAGPLLAAYLDLVGGWRASHLFLVALSAAVAIAAATLLTESRSARPRPVDYLGTLLLASGVSGVLAGLVVGRSGWTGATTLTLLGGGALLLCAFVASQARRANAMLDLALFRRADFVQATVGALANGLGVIALMSFIPTLVMRGLGASAITAAFTLLSWSGLSVVSALYARRLPATVSGRHQLVGSLAVIGASLLALTGLDEHSSVCRLLPALIVAGVASGFLNAALARQSVASVPTGSAALGSGANNTARYVGAALGVTVVVVLAGRRDPAALVAGWNVAALVTGGFSLLGAVVVAFCSDRSARRA